MYSSNKQTLRKCRLPDDYQEHCRKLMLGATKYVEHLRRINCRGMRGRLRVCMPVANVMQILFKEPQDVGFLRRPVRPEAKSRPPRPTPGHRCVFDAVGTSFYASKELPTNLASDAGGLATTGELLKAAVAELKAEVAVRVVQTASV